MRSDARKFSRLFVEREISRSRRNVIDSANGRALGGRDGSDYCALDS